MKISGVGERKSELVHGRVLGGGVSDIITPMECGDPPLFVVTEEGREFTIFGGILGRPPNLRHVPSDECVRSGV